MNDNRNLVSEPYIRITNSPKLYRKDEVYNKLLPNEWNIAILEIKKDSCEQYYSIQLDDGMDITHLYYLSDDNVSCALFYDECGVELNMKDYGKTWRVWTSPPSYEERMTKKWISEKVKRKCRPTIQNC